jgi:curved DNA-binding protein CbpA
MYSKRPIDYPGEDYLDPYDILGVDKTNSISEINQVYKRLILLLHPDKDLTSEAKRLGWSREDKNIAFVKVRTAYKKILEEKKESDVPDYNIEYYINEDLKQDNSFNNYNDYNNNNINNDDINNDIESGSVRNMQGNNFNNTSFNRFFEVTKKKQETSGFADPFSRGYSEMFSNRQIDADVKKEMTNRPDINVSMPEKFVGPEITNGRLVRFTPKEVNLSGNYFGNCSELGLSTVEDFSFRIEAKANSIDCSDLMSVYGQNNENWEDSVKRDSELYQRFSDTTKVDKKLNMYMGQRTDIDIKRDRDPELDKQLAREYEQTRKIDELRSFRLKKENVFYSDEFRNRLGN